MSCWAGEQILIFQSKYILMFNFATPKKQSLPLSPSQIPYNPAATQNLLRELKYSLHGVDEIIQKSRDVVHSDGYKAEGSLERSNSFQLNISCNISLNGDESDLRYSLTPQNSKQRSPHIIQKDSVGKWSAPQHIHLKKKLHCNTTPEKQERQFYQKSPSNSSYYLTTYKKPIPERATTIEECAQEESERNQTKIEPQKSHQKTCTRNELENLLGLNQIIEKQAIRQQQEKRQGKKVIKTHSKTRLASSKERDPQRSSKKSISPLKFTPNKKSTYIEKFANKTKLENEKKKSKSPMKKSPHKTIKKETAKNEAKANQSLRYFHPSPNKYKRRTDRESMGIHLGKPPMSREQFLSKMKEQCYVKRFLKEDELDTTYNELVNTRVDPYLWQQKVIEKIFKKIHETDNII